MNTQCRISAFLRISSPLIRPDTVSETYHDVLRLGVGSRGTKAVPPGRGWLCGEISDKYLQIRRSSNGTGARGPETTSIHSRRASHKQPPRTNPLALTDGHEMWSSICKPLSMDGKSRLWGSTALSKQPNCPDFWGVNVLNKAS